MARVFKLGHGISTDAIMPGRYNVTTDLAALGRACLIEARPDFADAVRPGDLIIAGSNFGCGSSREHAPLAIRAAGIAAVVAVSFARIFYRNAVNIGLAVITCEPVYDLVADGDTAEIDVRSGEITVRGQVCRGDRPPEVARRIMAAGSLVQLVKERGWAAVEEEV